MFIEIVTSELAATKVIRVGVEAGNFLTNTSSTTASGCGEQLPANRQENDVAGNLGIR
jgi:hypothetical protein